MTKDLLIKLRDHIKDKPYLDYGLCHEIWDMWSIDSTANSKEFTEEEYRVLRDYIYCNRPKRGKHFDEAQVFSSYYWPETYVKPRLDWLNAKIKQCK